MKNSYSNHLQVVALIAPPIPSAPTPVIFAQTNFGTTLMLEWFEHPQTTLGAEMIRRAVQKVLSDPANRTATPAEKFPRGKSATSWLAVFSMSKIIGLTLALKARMRGFASEPKYTVARDGWNANASSRSKTACIKSANGVS